MHGYEFEDSKKEMLVDCLLKASQPQRIESNLPDLQDVPSLMLCMQMLETDNNGDQIKEIVENLSMAYLATSGTRIDVLGASTLWSGWAYTGMNNVDMFNFCSNIIFEKINDGSFFEEVAHTELISMLSSMHTIGYLNEQLLEAILLNLATNIQNIPINWLVIMLKTMASSQVSDPTKLLSIFVQMVPDVHKKLKLAYESKSKERNTLLGARENRY